MAVAENTLWQNLKHVSQGEVPFYKYVRHSWNSALQNFKPVLVQLWVATLPIQSMMLEVSSEESSAQAAAQTQESHEHFTKQVGRFIRAWCCPGASPRAGQVEMTMDWRSAPRTLHYLVWDEDQ